MKLKYIFLNVILIFNITNIKASESNSSIVNSWKFIKKIPENYSTIGAISPFSQSTANCIIKYLEQYILENQNNKLMFLEVGAGTGNLTFNFVQLLENLNINYQLDIVELNPDFCLILQDRFKDYPKVNVYCEDVTKWDTKTNYNIIVSTLPFNSQIFTSPVIDEIINKFESLIEKSGLIIYVEYIFVGKIYKNLLSNKKKKDFESKQEILNAFKQRHETKRDIVLNNIPPTYLYFLKTI